MLKMNSVLKIIVIYFYSIPNLFLVLEKNEKKIIIF